MGKNDFWEIYVVEQLEIGSIGIKFGQILSNFNWLGYGMKSNYGFQEKIPNGYLLYHRSIKHILSNNNIVNS